MRNPMEYFDTTKNICRILFNEACEYNLFPGPPFLSFTKCNDLVRIHPRLLIFLVLIHAIHTVLP